ncbi:MAG: tetratricopeptide repeat protein [Terriglobia bacterium]
MPAVDLFTRKEVLRIAGVSPRQLSRWEHLRLLQQHPSHHDDDHDGVYTFSDIIAIKTIQHLTEQGVSPFRLADALQALHRQLAQVEAPLAELRILSNGRNVAVEYAGRTVEPISGQFLLDFEVRDLEEKVRAMPERTADEWFDLALECERDPQRRADAVEAYRRVVEAQPEWVEPRLNLGTLLYEQGDVEGARECYRAAVDHAPGHALARFDLGSVLDEMKQFEEAAEHLREAVRLDPAYADAHYNLARVYDEMGRTRESLPHWRRYLEIDPTSVWADHVRERLGLKKTGAGPMLV